MILKRLKQNKDGQIEATWMLSNEQFNLLLNYAIDSLLSRGLISTIDISEEEVTELQQAAEAEAATDLLSKLDATKLPQA